MADHALVEQLRRRRGGELGMACEELRHGAHGVVPCPFRLGAWSTDKLFHDAVGDDDIRTDADQWAIGFKFFADVVLSVIGVEQDQDLFGWLDLGFHFRDNSRVG